MPSRNARSEHVVLDDQFYASHLTREFSASRDHCVEALRRSFVDMGIGLEVDQLEGARHHLITSRRENDAVAMLPGSSSNVSAHGRSQSGEYVTTHATVNSPSAVFTMKEQFKLYLYVTGDQSSCRIAGYRFRAWLQGKEITNDLRVGGIQYADEHYFNPMFAEVEERLRTPLSPAATTVPPAAAQSGAAAAAP